MLAFGHDAPIGPLHQQGVTFQTITLFQVAELHLVSQVLLHRAGSANTMMPLGWQPILTMALALEPPNLSGRQSKRGTASAWRYLTDMCNFYLHKAHPQAWHYNSASAKPSVRSRLDFKRPYATSDLHVLQHIIESYAASFTPRTAC